MDEGSSFVGYLTLQKLMAALMPTADGIHNKIAFGHLRHILNRLGQDSVIYSEMLHGIQMEAHSYATVVHGRDQKSH